MKRVFLRWFALLYASELGFPRIYFRSCSAPLKFFRNQASL